MAFRINTASINRVLLGFFGAFVVLSALAAVYQVMWVLPEKRCLAAHHWWDPSQRVCATPIDLRMFTGRPNKVPAPVDPAAKPAP